MNPSKTITELNRELQRRREQRFNATDAEAKVLLVLAAHPPTGDDEPDEEGEE